MKKLFLTIVSLIALTTVKGQSLVYTDSLLNTMNKMTLTDIYLNQVNQLGLSLPYTPFTLDGKDTLNNQLDIPTSKYLGKKRSSIADESTRYGELMRERLYEIVPYSDKKDIIGSILFLQNVNNSIKTQVK